MPGERHPPPTSPFHPPSAWALKRCGVKELESAGLNRSAQGHPNLPLIRLDLNSQALGWSRQAGGGLLGGGFLAHNFQSMVQGAHRKSHPRARAQPLLTWLLFDAVFVSSLDFPAAAWDPSSVRLFVVVATGKHPQTRKPCLYGKG